MRKIFRAFLPRIRGVGATLMQERRVLIDAAGAYTRVALCDRGELVEFAIEETADDSHLVGNVYRGKVVNVLQGMQAAFVDIGRERNAFLFVSDMPVDRRDIASDIRVPDRLGVRVGQEILCQVLKDEVGTKGARVSANLSLVGRFTVATPTMDFYGVSRKIEDAETRERALDNLRSSLPEGWGGIARTQSQDASRRAVSREIRGLKKLYEEIMLRFQTASVGEIVYRDGDLVYRVARDIVDENVAEIVVNDAAIADKIAKYLQYFGLKPNVTPYPLALDLFGDFGVTPQIRQLVSNRVRLKSGGNLYIDKTEALTVIDVNSSKYVGSTQLEDTVFAVNLEAADEIARQLRLRNLGGIIIVDFIDMETEEHRGAVLARLETLLKKDRIKTRLAGMTQLGLVQITRKKTRHDVDFYLQEACPHCGGSGKVLTGAIVVPIVSRKINAAFADASVRSVLVAVHPAVFEKLIAGALGKECGSVWQGKRVYARADDRLARDEVKLNAFKANVLSLPDDAKLLY